MFPSSIPRRSETLEILRLISEQEPILMLAGDADGLGARWTLSGQEIQPAIVRFLKDSGFITETGKTGMGAIKLGLTKEGIQSRNKGLKWWSELSFLQKMKVTLLG